MSIVNTRDKTICTKIVYYGPGLGGKTTSLKRVHATLDPERRMKLVTLKTDEERTLFFDFLPIDLGLLGDYKVRLQAFTVPGQVKYNLTRRYVLMGADAVVFVADSQADRLDDNIESMLSLGDNLASIGVDINQLPLVLQYNKRDLPDVCSPELLREKLNFAGAPEFFTSAMRGEGVFEAFVETSKRMLDHVAERYHLSGDDEHSVGMRLAQRLTNRTISG